MTADRHPHCAWTVIIDESHPEVAADPGAGRRGRHPGPPRSRSTRSTPTDEGQADYAGPLVSDLDFAAFSHSALVRIADEVCLQMHLLNLGFLIAVRARADLAGAGHGDRHEAAGRHRRRRRRADPPRARHRRAARRSRLHPLLNPAAYVDAPSSTARSGHARPGRTRTAAGSRSAAPTRLRPLQAAVRAVDPHLDVEVTGSATDWTATVVRRDEPAPDFDEVAVTRISTGASFTFEPRRSLPITPV